MNNQSTATPPKKIRLPFIIAFTVIILLGAAAVTRNILVQKAHAEELAWENELANLTWEQLSADPDRYGVIDPRSLNDLYEGQTEGGVCTHDETFTEPVIPDGKYYPDGDPNAEYYLEIKGNILCYRDKNGDYYGQPGGIHGSRWYGEREYRVITWHYSDKPFLCTDWTEYRNFPGCPYLNKYSPRNGMSIEFDENGKAYLPSAYIGDDDIIDTLSTAE